MNTNNEISTTNNEISTTNNEISTTNNEIPTANNEIPTTNTVSIQKNQIIKHIEPPVIKTTIPPGNNHAISQSLAVIICVVGLIVTILLSFLSHSTGITTSNENLGVDNITTISNDTTTGTDMNNSTSLSTGNNVGYRGNTTIETKNQDGSTTTEVRNPQGQTLSLETKDKPLNIVLQDTDYPTTTIQTSPTSNDGIKGTPTKDLTPRIMMRPGKVNQYVNSISGSWESDGDGESGAQIDPLLYCKKWYPRTIRTEKYKEETISTWKSAGNQGNYTGTTSSIACIQH